MLSDDVEKDKAEDMVLLYKSYSRVNTDFLRETLKSAGIPFQCQLKGGLMGRGTALGVGIFKASNEDALFFVPSEFLEEAKQIQIQTVGED